MAILSRGESGVQQRGYQVLLDEARLVIRLVNQPRISLVDVVTGEPLSLNSWHHVAVTSDGTGKAAGVSVYVDGELRPVQVRADSLAGSIATESAARVCQESEYRKSATPRHPSSSFQH